MHAALIVDESAMTSDCDCDCGASVSVHVIESVTISISTLIGVDGWIDVGDDRGCDCDCESVAWSRRRWSGEKTKKIHAMRSDDPSIDAVVKEIDGRCPPPC